MMIADFRSDTLTKPTKEMLDAIFSAEVGDDVFGEDVTVNKLENMAALMFGKEAALFCPSGTMANQIAIKAHTNAPGELICDQLSHVYLYEVGGIAFHSGLNVNLTAAERGILKAEDISSRINPETDMHKALTQLVVLENTCNKGGGSCYDLDNIKSISKLCKEKNIRLHLDGARIFNAMAVKGYNALQIGSEFDSISICLSKGLGTPMGSVLLGDSIFINKARRLRKLFGGGMRQIGFMAAAGIFALENNIERLNEDHQRAILLGDALQKTSFTDFIFPIETNIVIVRLKPHIVVPDLLLLLSSKGIKAVAFGPQLIRFVTHLDIGDTALNYAIDTLKKI
jgi:threonine aldolase